MSKYHYVIGETCHSSPKTVVIMGAPRGGTSMVAGTVRELGINLGKRLGENHEDPRFLTTERAKLLKVIGERNEQNDDWGWKMPHSIDYIDEIEDELRNPHFILVWRNVLATAISQVNRSDTDLNNALQFSMERQGTMVEKAEKLKGPIMFVDYDRAISNKQDFVDAVSGYLGVDLTDEIRRNCMRFIDPSVGYQQVSSTFYDVQGVDDADYPNAMEAKKVLRQLEETPDRKVFKVVGRHPAFIFRTGKNRPLPEEFVVRFENKSDTPQQVRILFDFDWEFSQNLAHKPVLGPGVHAFRVQTNGLLKRCAVLPPITDGESDLFDVELRQV